MSEQQIDNIKQLPHQLLLTRHNLTQDDLSSHGKQMLMDLKKTLTGIFNLAKSKGGEVRISPATQQKVSTYDRYICDSIFEALEKEESIDNAQIEREEKVADDLRDKVEDKMETAEGKAEDKTEDITSPVSGGETVSTDETKNKVKIGFWDWK